MASKKPAKKTSSRRAKRSPATPLKSQDKFVRRSHLSGASTVASSPALPFLSRAMGVNLEVPFRLARCTTPFQVWAEQMRTCQRLLAAWQRPSA
jgi:hypothetical protein